MLRVLKYPCPITFDEGNKDNVCKECKTSNFHNSVFNQPLKLCNKCLSSKYYSIKVRDLTSQLENLKNEFENKNGIKKEYLKYKSLRIGMLFVFLLTTCMLFFFGYKGYEKFSKSSDKTFKNLNIQKYFHEAEIEFDKASNYIKQNHEKITHTIDNTQSEAKKHIDKKYSLIVKVEPIDSKVRIMEIKPKYYDGIVLDPGTYTVEISNDDYVTEKFSVVMKDKNLIINKQLKPKKK